jgi:hypothetical protein
MHPLFSYEIAQSRIRELHRQAEIDRLVGRPRESKAPAGRSFRRGLLRRLVRRPAAA